ncbi:hypothetical protein AGRA3207_005992 [Actinomadura graeca]|uniref:Uncharacterized protein n=1 Tax=Actinomadura graeca TaxID=2750812 RepID=A0ABX8R0L0_9ACTN|nr:hypothetical protein [Actinomadura graeca]QXJ24625.1 hypothetical protein AGRA3207_005992 [Actinomadura graeca]
MYVASSANRRLAAAGLAVAAAAIPVQIAGGMDYPVVPPGLVILAAGALVALLARPRWALIVPAVIAVFLSFGAVVTDNARDALGDPGDVLAFAGTVVQCAGLVTGLVFCALSLAERAPATPR